MIDYKDCIVSIGVRDFPPLPPRKKRPPRKCSTCANQECRVSGKACNWTHCKEWRAYDE